MISETKRRVISRALLLGLAAGVLTLTSCSTVESRVSDHPEIYNNLSPNNQALVREGRIRSGMSSDAVWLAWGNPDQKIAGNMRGRETETWVYVQYETAYPYGYGYPYGYPYGPYGYGYGFGYGGIGVVHAHHGHRFVFFGDPFYDPFFYSWYIPPSIPVPYRTVTFANGRVVSFQYLMNPHR
jgi:hypothetical protein